MAEFNERYCVYEPSTNQVLKVCETKQEAISETKFANVFRKMCGKSLLIPGKCKLTQEELNGQIRINGSGGVSNEID